MTFRPTKCCVLPNNDDGLSHLASVTDSGGAKWLAYPPSGRCKPNALIVPLVPGMEAVVRAHLAAKPKPAKKKGRAK